MTRYNHMVDPELLNVADISRIRQHLATARSLDKGRVTLRIEDVERLVTEHDDMRRDLAMVKKLIRELTNKARPLLHL